MGNGCLWCGGDASEPNHWRHCDGQQGHLEDAIERAVLNAETDPDPDDADLGFDNPHDAPDFDGETYEPEIDHDRLGAQALRVWTVVSDAQWRTLAAIEQLTGDPQASISARLRDFRKGKFGAHTVERRRRDDQRGLFEYRVIPRPLKVAV
jgi:hypothetical protein